MRQAFRGAQLGELIALDYAFAADGPCHISTWLSCWGETLFLTSEGPPKLTLWLAEPLSDSCAMIYRFPRQLPSFAQLMEDPLLYGVPSAQLCKVFKVSPRTLRRWQAKNAPRAIRLALWAVSLDGASNREVEAHNRAIQALGLERCLTEETKRLRQVVALLLRVGTFGSANEPLWISEDVLGRLSPAFLSGSGGSDERPL